MPERNEVATMVASSTIISVADIDLISENNDATAGQGAFRPQFGSS
jgi:hypothetical protein